jgi:hypothetical protein
MTRKITAKGKTRTATTAKPASKSKSTPRAAPKKAKAPVDNTPVTLEQARALAAAAGPRRATRRMTMAAPSPADVGIEREKLEQQREDEREQRLRDYKATMTIMKKRGAARSAAPAKGRRGPAKAPKAAFQPLQVMAEGDSWFDYPFPLFGGGIVKRLEKRLGVPILNMAEAGDEVRFMLGVDQRKRLIKQLKDGCPAGGPWEVVLFSGGGNDIVDNPMALWIRDFDANAAPAALIHQARFDAALALVRAAYEDLITLRDQLSPATHLVFHGYDFAIPDGRGACHLGPWLKPTFDLRRFPTRAAAFEVVKVMLGQFAAMLQTLTAHANVTVIKTQGTLAPQTSAWHNELHPAKPGFDTFADMFRQELKALFPTRVV